MLLEIRIQTPESPQGQMDYLSHCGSHQGGQSNGPVQDNEMDANLVQNECRTTVTTT